MPSDAAKKRAEAKKNAAKKRGQKKPMNGENGEDGEDSSGTEALRSAGSSSANLKSAGGSSASLRSLANGKADPAMLELMSKLERVELENANARAVAGTLTSHPQARDTQVNGLTITFYGVEIVADTQLELNMGRRYGLIGLNGSGKTCLLQAIARREIPIPEHIDLFLLSREIAASDKTALQSVIDVDAERSKLEAEAEELASAEDDESQERLMDLYDRLDSLGSDMAEVKAAEILFGLGFTPTMQRKACKDFSGGWRMRIALARALYLKPSLLLLDEPTNHLDLDACVWLEKELANYKRCLVMVSHSQDFMNGVCTNIIHLWQKKLQYFGGNYDAFIKTRMELMENQAKRYKWEQDQIAHMKEYVARFGHGSAKLARQAQSKEKTMKKMIDGGLTEKVVTESVKQFYFNDPGMIPPPVIMVQNISFRYNDSTPYIYKNLDFGVDLETRIALVGPNGAGKSTLLKLLTGELVPTDGIIRRHSHVSFGLYHQHLAEKLDLEMSALDWMLKSFPHIREREEMRKVVGRYGLTGRQQTCPMKQLSDGQRCRVSFAWLATQNPHLLLLDEPTNHLDIESIDALAEAINEFQGGLILVSHDFRLVSQVASVIWVCEHQTVTPWEGNIFSYKKFLSQRIEKEQRKRAAMGK